MRLYLVHRPCLAHSSDFTLLPPWGPRASWGGDICQDRVVCVRQLFEGVCSLLDRLGAWPHLANGTADLREMAQIGLRLVLGYILLEDPQVSMEGAGAAGVGCRVLRAPSSPCTPVFTHSCMPRPM